MRVLVFISTLLFIHSAGAAVGSMTDPEKIPEQVLTIEFVQHQGRQCNSRNRITSIHKPGGEALLGILLAAKESGIEVETIEGDDCSDGLKST